jgi:hypothetical protein
MGELLNLVGLSAGVVLYAILLVMVLCAPAVLTLDGRGDRLLLTTAILGLVWNVCAIVIFELPNVGIWAPIGIRH